MPAALAAGDGGGAGPEFRDVPNGVEHDLYQLHIEQIVSKKCNLKLNWNCQQNNPSCEANV